MKRLFNFPWRTRRRIASDAADELGFHLDARTDALVAQGLARDDARAQALREFGDVAATARFIAATDAVTESTRRRRDHFHELVQDVAYAFRKLRASPTFAVTAILTLAFGIGVNTAVFNLVNAAVFRPPPVRDPGSLAWVTLRDRQHQYGMWSVPDFEAFRAAAKRWTGLAAFSGIDATITDRNPIHAVAQVVSANYFDVTGVRPILGRGFVAREDTATAGSVPVILGHELWRTHFGGDSGIVGRVTSINSNAVTIVGVAPEGFNGLHIGDEIGFWVPLSSLETLFASQRSGYLNAGSQWLSVVGRLAPGTDLDAAGAEAATISPRLETSVKDSTMRRTAAVMAVKGGLDPTSRTKVATMLGLLMLVPLFVLGIACANVANLFLARSVQREREIAVRRALGASRGRIIRQLLTECVVLGVIAGGVGMVASAAITAIVGQLGSLPPDVMILARPDGTVVTATIVLAVLAGAAFGLAPSLAATSSAITPALKSDGLARAVGGARHRLRNAFVVSQVALSLALIITAGLFVGSVRKALTLDPGYDPRNAVIARLDLGALGYDSARARNFTRQLMTRLATEPGVEAATYAELFPVSGGSFGTMAWHESDPDSARGLFTYYAHVAPSYFGALRMPIVRGREFTDTDTPGAPPVAIVNARFAELFWPGEDPIGKRFRAPGDSGKVLLTVVGVARNAKYRSLTEDPPMPHIWKPEAQRKAMLRFAVMARSSLGTAGAAQAVRRVILAMDPGIPVFRLTTMDEGIASSVGPQRAAAAMLAVAGLLALGLAALGIFGVIAHGVVSRTREIGIRMSLGARAVDVVAQFVREGLRLTMIGTTIGVLLGGAGSKIVASLLFGLTPGDLVTFAAAVVVLVLVAAIASLIPARRAAAVSPMVALRSD